MPTLSRTPFTPPPYATMAARNALMRGTTEGMYATSVASFQALTGLRVSSITYDSDGLAVTGVEALPDDLGADERMPLLIYNRGGSGDYGMLSAGQVNVLMAPLAKALRCGVLASNYRGNGDSEGTEEFGGADVRDVLNLITLGQQQPWWDGKNIFMLGWSRGGMMAYLAMKAGAPLTAVAVGAGVSDLRASSQHQADMIDLYERRIPEYPTRGDAALAERSAIEWSQALRAPLLMLHGDADDRIEVGQARALHAALRTLGREVRYVEYPGGDHALKKHWKHWTQEVIDWFTAHRAG